jgi:Mor family transcriptional regulator
MMEGFLYIISREGHPKGLETIRGLTRIWGGARVTFLTEDKLNHAQRDQEIRNMYSHGSTYCELAHVFKLKEGRIRGIIHGKSKKNRKPEEDEL